MSQLHADASRWAAISRRRNRRRPLANWRRLLAIVAGAVLAGTTTAAVPAFASGVAGRGSGAQPLRVVHTFPASGARAENGASRLAFEFSSPLAPGLRAPSIVPAIAGSWSESGRWWYFSPQGAFAPGSEVTVTVAGGPGGARSTTGSRLARRDLLRFQVAEAGSVVGAEEVLATLGYLPVRLDPTPAARFDAATAERALFVPLPGRFVFSFDAPTALRSQWAPGRDDTILRGALMAFQQASGLAVSGELDTATWKALGRAAKSLSSSIDRSGYSYALVRKTLPERLTLWHNGKVVLETLANTGISESPTADGTYPVYERLASQVMQGTSPWGTHYSDPVSWVAYFNGSEAVHYIYRGDYGFPQSFGCVELPLQSAAEAWPRLTLGSLVTITG